MGRAVTQLLHIEKDLTLPRTVPLPSDISYVQAAANGKKREQDGMNRQGCNAPRADGLLENQPGNHLVCQDLVHVRTRFATIFT